MGLFSKTRTCGRCGGTFDKKALHEFDTRPDPAWQLAKVERYLADKYEKGEQTYLCDNCARQMLLDYFEDFTHKLIVVKNDDPKKYNAMAFYPLDYLRLFDDMAGGTDNLAFANALARIIAHPCACGKCGGTGQFWVAEMDFFKKSDPFTFTVSPNATPPVCLCKKCFLSTAAHDIAVTEFVYPPLDIGDGIFMPWQV